MASPERSYPAGGGGWEKGEEGKAEEEEEEEEVVVVKDRGQEPHTITLRGLVEQRWLISERFINGLNDARHGGVNVRGGLDGFDRSDRVCNQGQLICTRRLSGKRSDVCVPPEATSVPSVGSSTNTTSPRALWA